MWKLGPYQFEKAFKLVFLQVASKTLALIEEFRRTQMQSPANKTLATADAMGVRVGRIRVCVALVNPPHLAGHTIILFQDMASVSSLPLRNANANIHVLVSFSENAILVFIITHGLPFHITGGASSLNQAKL